MPAGRNGLEALRSMSLPDKTQVAVERAVDASPGQRSAMQLSTSPSGSGRVELFMRTKKTRSSLLVLAQTGREERATSRRQISLPSWTAILARLRMTAAWPTALARCVVSQLTKPSPFGGFTLP